jgi:hypothetical protein
VSAQGELLQKEWNHHEAVFRARLAHCGPSPGLVDHRPGSGRGRVPIAHLGVRAAEHQPARVLPEYLTDSELVCVAVAQALLGFTSEAHWLRYARKHVRGLFPYLPQQSGYNKRLRAALGLVKRVIRMLARSSDFWLDECWIADSTPVPCGMSRPTVKRSELAGWAGYGYCASHSRFYWGLKLYLVCAPSGMPILWALADPRIGEREVLAAMLEVDAAVTAEHEHILLICDKGFAGHDFETLLGEYGITSPVAAQRGAKALTAFRASPVARTDVTNP